MFIDVRAIGFSLTAAIRTHDESRVNSALGPFAHSVVTVTARLEDVNAGRGGIDKRCRLVATVRRQGTLVTEAMDEDLYVAVDEQRALCAWENEGGARGRSPAQEVSTSIRKEFVVRTRLYDRKRERNVAIRPHAKSRCDFGETLSTAGEAVVRIAAPDRQRRPSALPEGDALITDADRKRLSVALRRLSDSGRGRRENLSSLRRRLERAEIVTPAEIPRNVVTLNSQLVLKDLDSRGRLVCTLAEPWDRSPPGDRISVSGPAGTELLGSRVGQIVRWRIGARDRRFRIEQILYQPEAAGDLHL